MFYWENVPWLTQSQVLRRHSYKGETKIVYSLPVDASSTIGFVGILGTILPAKSLTPEALQSCKVILQTLQGETTMHEISGPCPKSGAMISIEANDQGLFLLKDLQSMFKQMGINFSRYGLGKKNMSRLTN